MSPIDPKDVTDAARGAGEIAKLARDVYADLVSPAAREVSATYTAAARTVLKPIRGALWTIEQAEDWLGAYVARRLERLKVPPDAIQTPHKQLYVGAVMGLVGSGDVEDVRDLFGNLLATAMDANRAAQIHPAFAEIIRQLSREDALLLRGLSPGSLMRIGFWAITHRSSVSTMDLKRLSIPDEIQGLSRDQTAAAVANLLRLGLIEVIANNSPSTPRGRESDAVALTSFGDQFWLTCVADEPATGRT